MTCNRERARIVEMFHIVVIDNKVALRADVNGRFCSGEEEKRAMRCDREKADTWELFEQIKNEDGTVAFKCSGGKYVSSMNGEKPMICMADVIGPTEKFRIG
jgi:hypothetical protein